MRLAYLCLMLGSGMAVSTPLSPWGDFIDRMKTSGGEQTTHLDKIVADARDAAIKPIIIRAKTIEDVGKNRTWLDGRANALEPEIRETFALAMSDFGACSTLAQELPLMAAAYRLTGDRLFLDRIILQLNETVSWSPLQRPGWTLYQPGARLPADGRDGNWLATGCGIRAIADTLEILPEDAVPAELRGRLMDLFRHEIDSIVDDWHTRRPWFVRSDNPVTNQWVLPTEGLVRACLVFGGEKGALADAYELGVANLIKALDAHGRAGEFEEGVGYASFTVTSMLHAARAMAVRGDQRALEHPFLKNFPTWLVHHLQPGDLLINCFDAGSARDGASRLQPLLSLLVACTGSPVAKWALDFQTSGPSDSLEGLAARAMPRAGEADAPPLFAAYEHAARVNWRSSWMPDATGIWVRGGHPLDQHDHHDRGHVNFIHRGRAILIEAGTPYYHHPFMGSHFSSGAGHNVLQLGVEEPAPVNAGDTQVKKGWQERGVVAPIQVNRLNADGGEISMAIHSGYDGLKQWRRKVAWDAQSIQIDDAVELAPDRSEIVAFRWHLGTNEPVTLEQADPTGTQVTASWKDGKIEIRASGRILLNQGPMPDNTVNEVSDDGVPDPMHTCLLVRSKDPVAKFKMITAVRGND